MTLIEAFRDRLGDQLPCHERVYDLQGSGQLATGVNQSGDRYVITLLSNLPEALTLHWGMARRFPNEWFPPPASSLPPGTALWKNEAAQTPFTRQAGLNQLRLEFPASEAPLGIQCVLKTESGKWLKNGRENFYIPVKRPSNLPVSPPAPELTELADEIVRAETGRNSWTLMHRFNLCYDLLDLAESSAAALALLFVWLRFSAIRQLTWQRNYNTKPRELSHAQDRLTHKLAEVYRRRPEHRPMVRLMLGTVGRGGEGQRIRDEILNIMHRHQVKEVSGHFLEEWHQKLHNNTTPDDVVICQAYLDFLRSNGNRDRFYQVLSEGGVARERLESFERPIRSAPDFVPHLKDGLIYDFEQFLRTLKAIHSGTDLETSINAVRGRLDGDTQGKLDFVWQHRNDPGVSWVVLVSNVTELRRRLAGQLLSSPQLRDLLYLDLALEQWLRTVVEGNIHSNTGLDALVDLVVHALINFNLSHADEELGVCSSHWERLTARPRSGRDWALHSKAVLDRISRGLGGLIDHTYQLLQPQAEYLGRAFQADPWAITLFSEEVVRGSSLGFVLSALVRHLEPLLRGMAHLGNWQIISRGRGWGRVEAVEQLRSIQGKTFDGPRVIVADKVFGDEEIPDNVTAVITPDVTDIVSHVAVRARNARLLFAACYDTAIHQRLKSFEGRSLRLEVNPAGDVVIEESVEQPPSPPASSRPAFAAPNPSRFTAYAIAVDDFKPALVGGKSMQQANLHRRLPEWIHQPPSLSLPFAVFDKVLACDQNRELARRHAKLLDDVDSDDPEVRVQLRDTILGLDAPEELIVSLRDVFSRTGLGWPDDWEGAWRCIKQVWASKWNDRAYLSRRARGIPYEALYMAVLVQEVVPADYAFVIHTVNPMSGNRDELFAEVVLGLGETLVGNYPGRALGFIWNKTAGQPTLLAYPAKSLGLYGGSLIFRSDSNGEDLAGFAGAGLYDSVLLPAPRQMLLDYTRERLVWEDNFRKQLLDLIARAGLEVERLCGAPQDIEGAVAHDQLYVVQSRPQVGI
ncbi:MAG: hypothetical protein M1608_01005 [Candidatus Omnitrophica bacterium]|nr:hypothetical protein [Candidatus Omnitrophota bacterium]